MRPSEERSAAGFAISGVAGSRPAVPECCSAAATMQHGTLADNTHDQRRGDIGGWHLGRSNSVDRGQVPWSGVRGVGVDGHLVSRELIRVAQLGGH